MMEDSESLRQARLDMVRDQIMHRGVKNKRVLDAMRKVPRHDFVPEEYLAEAYADHPLPIGDGQTISQPYIVALMTEQLNLTGSEKVLEIGTGSGYQAAILAELAKEVHTLERISTLAERAGRTLLGLGYNNVKVHTCDGTLGWSDEAPYEGIIITAGTPEMPEGLVDQLAQGGRLVAPVGSRWRQMLELWTKHGEEVEKEEILPVVFVPLIGEKGWREVDL